MDPPEKLIVFIMRLQRWKSLQSFLIESGKFQSRQIEILPADIGQ